MATFDNARKESHRHNWADVYDLLSARDEESPLSPEDGERLAVAAYLLGKDLESAENWSHAHNQYLERGDLQRAIRCAFWAAYVYFNRREDARGGAWIARGHRLMDKVEGACVEEGYLLIPKALEYIGSGDSANACAALDKAIETGEQFKDSDLIAMARHARGRVLLRMGKVQEGSSMFDEAMIEVEAGDVSPIVAGEVYCSAISGCLEVFDYMRAKEWTAALTRWCDSQPDMVTYNGQCLVHRAEILRFRGEWQDALEAAQNACRQCLEGPDQAAIGAAYYQRAELYRLRGEFSKAEEDYLQANRQGRKAQPGLCLLRLAQGQIGAARAAIESAMAQFQERRIRLRLLPACVDIMLADEDVKEARRAAEELTKIADENPGPFQEALAAQAQGMVHIGDGDARSSLSLLRHAWTIWRDLEAIYEAAKVRVLIGIACKELGDKETAMMEFDAAYWIFQQLGASPDQNTVESMSGSSSSGDRHGLTPREIEVLRLAAAGKTNKAIASELFISERTVDRHISNIFLKLDVESRTAAASYAFKHNLI